MSKIKSFTSVFFVMLSVLLSAQSSDEALIKIDGDDLVVSKSDFEYVYQKNLENSKKNKKSPSDFLDSYITFLLNVEEAKKQGLDKYPNFEDEYSSYIEYIEKPYISDSITSLKVAKNVYKKLKENIEVSHILIKIPDGYILPKDTIDAYKRAISIRNIAIGRNAPSFESLALEYSQDSISKYSRQPGYLGWKTSLAGPIEFEEAIYSNPIGTITKPIRTNLGYHLIKIHNKRPDRGQINIAHILLAYPQQNPSEEQKDSLIKIGQKIHDELLSGVSFADLCQKYSADRETADIGGNLGWFGVNRPLPESIDSLLFGIKEVGTVTIPVEFPYGYHIFKILDKVSLSPFDKMEKGLVKGMYDSDRKQLFVKEKIKKLSENYSYQVNNLTYKELELLANNYTFSDTIFFQKIIPLTDNVLLTVDESNYSVEDFFSYIEEKPTSNNTLSTDILFEKLNDFTLEKLIDAERKSLPRKYPEYRHLTSDYYNGILYFDIMNKEVWSKAQSDKEALQELFNKDQHKYVWGAPKYKGYVIHAKNKKDIKRIKDFLNDNKNPLDLEKELKASLGNDFMINIIIEKGLWAQGENSYVDQILYKSKNEEKILGYPEFIIEGKRISTPEVLDDVYGEVVNDYQSILENQWNEYLRQKYKVEVDKEVLKSITLIDNNK